MAEEAKYGIGEFAKRTGISVRTLHYYDELGLLVPEKNVSSGHRVYSEGDIRKLQKILSLKFLGYSLETIREMLEDTKFSLDLVDTLSLHLTGLQEEKERIEKSITAIERTIKLLKEEGEVDSLVLMSLISNIQTENIQKDWLQKHVSDEIVEVLFNKSEEDKLALDKEYIHLTKELKHLFGKPVDNPEVQSLVERYIHESFKFLGEEAMNILGEAKVDEEDIKEFEAMVPSPFTKEEEEWLNQAIEYLMMNSTMSSEEDN
ncbi:MerR family transcriptional regulator [Ornithinibacillus scapharcae]|uniref:MerR family transcriptional regulator n=1 Tax=Ornithinibacillus scapharcae TaxID=1147159 RepID=UPI000225AB75|nr:MerR family transcriptional regulator [Ornithinibacillus scapharcae]